MKVTWKKQSSSNKRSFAAVSKYPNLPFDDQNHNSTEGDDIVADAQLNQDNSETLASEPDQSHTKRLAATFADQGNKLAEDGKYQEALGKWEAALSLMPESAVVHEQKAQVLLEIGNAWEALKAAARATELEPTWAEAWITLGRAQLNFGEPDSAIKSFDKALAIKPDSEEAQDDKQTALRLVKRREQLHSSGLSNAKYRYAVGDESKS